MPGLLKEERLHQIIEIARLEGRVIPAEISRILGVSEVTIRRDLQYLATKGILKRSHGGALIAKPGSEEPPVIQRLQENRSIKEAIGEAAADLIEDNETVFIGSGSTPTYVARNLVARKNLTVVTNGLSIAMELATATGVTVVVLGGMLRTSELSLIGHIAEQALNEVRVDKVVMGIPAISLESGLTNDYLPEVMTDRAIIDMAQQLILVADHTKFGKVASAYLAPLSRVSILVTDSQTDSEMLDRIREMGIKVILAD